MFYLMLTGLIRVGSKLIQPKESYPIRLLVLQLTVFYLMLTGLIKVGSKLIQPKESYPIRLLVLQLTEQWCSSFCQWWLISGVVSGWV
jgi:hypothetical protein